MNQKPSLLGYQYYTRRSHSETKIMAVAKYFSDWHSIFSQKFEESLPSWVDCSLRMAEKNDEVSAVLIITFMFSWIIYFELYCVKSVQIRI